MSGSDEDSSDSKIGKITINTVLCFIQENIGSCSKDILLETVIKNINFDELKLASLQYVMILNSQINQEDQLRTMLLIYIIILIV